MSRNLNYAAQQNAKRQRFAPVALILAFTISVSIALVAFFPEGDLFAELSRPANPSPLTAEYLENLLAASPKQEQIRLLLVKQLIGLGKIFQAERVLHPLLKPGGTYYLAAKIENYQILRQRTYALKVGSDIRQQYKAKMRLALTELSRAPLTTRTLLQMANDALYLQQNQLTRYFFNRLKANEQALTLADAAHLGKLALSIGQYRMSAEYYFLAQKKSNALNEKRLYFIKAIKSLESGNQLTHALRMARTHIGDLKHDRETLAYLAKISLKANATKQAQQFIKDAVGLEYKKR